MTLRRDEASFFPHRLDHQVRAFLQTNNINKLTEFLTDRFSIEQM